MADPRRRDNDVVVIKGNELDQGTKTKHDDVDANIDDNLSTQSTAMTVDQVQISTNPNIDQRPSTQSTTVEDIVVSAKPDDENGEFSDFEYDDALNNTNQADDNLLHADTYDRASNISYNWSSPS